MGEAVGHLGASTRIGGQALAASTRIGRGGRALAASTRIGPGGRALAASTWIGRGGRALAASTWIGPGGRALVASTRIGPGGRALAASTRIGRGGYAFAQNISCVIVYFVIARWPVLQRGRSKTYLNVQIYGREIGGQTMKIQQNTSGPALSSLHGLFTVVESVFLTSRLPETRLVPQFLDFSFSWFIIFRFTLLQFAPLALPLFAFVLYKLATVGTGSSDSFSCSCSCARSSICSGIGRWPVLQRGRSKTYLHVQIYGREIGGQTIKTQQNTTAKTTKIENRNYIH